MSYVSDSNPRIATVLDQMRAVYKLLSVPREGEDGTRPLTRLHLHTLAYQVRDIRPAVSGRIPDVKNAGLSGQPDVTGTGTFLMHLIFFVLGHLNQERFVGKQRPGRSQGILA